MAVQSVSGQVSQNYQFTELATLGFTISTNPFVVTLPNIGLTYSAATGGAGNVDTVYAAQLTVNATTQAIDLFGGSLLSPSGKACVFARVREFIVAPVTTTAGFIVQVYASASNAPLWLPPVANPLFANPGGIIRLSDWGSITTGGYLIDTSHKSITFNTGSNNVTFNVLIVGNSSAS